ncbi:hypothetical protein [Mesorhizobium sp. M1A.F.Ca.ET.072.01.1.1]|uniref:hypothetical protein n=2 Tax=unclassified Mesorhizobium TaxID=325217 RepID=UPI001FE0B962|nr:hypothetical protein [Mesorhizobium sp. M1A.F.Ca.ET.072.01.1.1]
MAVEVLALGAALGFEGVAANPLSAARRLRGALFAGLKAKVITPAATAAATTVNLCMYSCSVRTARRISRGEANPTPEHLGGIDARQLAGDAFGDRIGANKGEAIHFV